MVNIDLWPTMYGSIKISVKKYIFMLYIVITISVESVLNIPV